jgi:hypothetical protein
VNGETTAGLRALADNAAGAAEGTIVYERQFERAAEAVPIEEWAGRAGWLSGIDAGVSAGVYAYHPPLAAMFTTAKRLMRKIAFSKGFEEHIFPRHYAVADLRAFGWLDEDELAGQLMAIRPLRPDESGTRGNDLTIGDPVQCLGFYAMLADVQRRCGGCLPDELFDEGAFCVYEDQGGWTLRNETTRRLGQGWGTCFEFSGAEFAFAGSAAQVYRVRWDVLCSITDLLTELRITHRVVAAGSCFHAKPGRIQLPQRVYDVPTLDIEVYIPSYAGERDPWLELGGGDIAGDAIAAAFGLRLGSGEPLVSGCQGIGWQRFALAVFSQLGTAPQAWPEKLRAEYGASRPRSRISDLFETQSRG